MMWGYTVALLCHAYSCDFAQTFARIHTKTFPNEALICLRSFSTAGRLDPSQSIFLMSIPAHSTLWMGLYYGELCWERIGTSIQIDTCSRRLQHRVSISINLSTLAVALLERTETKFNLKLVPVRSSNHIPHPCHVHQKSRDQALKEMRMCRSLMPWLTQACV